MRSNSLLSFKKTDKAQDRGTLRCPFCRDPIYPAPTIARCSACRTVHHEKCWEDSGKCSVFGCRGKSLSEYTEFFLIEAFQKRRKTLKRSWLNAVIALVFIGFLLYYLLEPVMPVEGRLIFSAAVVFFVVLLVLMHGFAQYLCPACGHVPRESYGEKRIWYPLLYPLVDRIVYQQSRFLLNPATCPNCKVRLR